MELAKKKASIQILDVATPSSTHLSGRFKKSFAYFTITERLPVILTQIINTMSMDRQELEKKYGPECSEEIKRIVGLISQLKYELQTNKQMGPLEEDAPDRYMWDRFLSKIPDYNRHYFQSCWLHTECYMYRKVWSFFESSKFLHEYDYFAKQKEESITNFFDALLHIANSTRRSTKDQETFVGLLKLCLWCNRCDLSLSSNEEVKELEDMFKMIHQWDENLLVDDTNIVWRCLTTGGRSEKVCIDIVCDNMGLEIYSDFILAEYLIEKEMADKVIFHVKPIPWFVSDVTHRDIIWLLQYFSAHCSPLLREMGKRWKRFMCEGKFELAPPEHFWTSPYDFTQMRFVRPTLHCRMLKSRLLIFKGDLNYRKLLNDFNWNDTEEFVNCLRGFVPTNICSLRTIKSDLICGLPEGVGADLTRKHDGKGWMTTGEYGSIQFAPKPHGGPSYPASII